MNQLQQSKLEVESLFLPVAEIVKGSQHGIQKARQILFGKRRCHPLGARSLFVGNLEEIGICSGEPRHQAVAQKAHHLTRDLLWAVAGVEQLLRLAAAWRRRSDSLTASIMFSNT